MSTPKVFRLSAPIIEALRIASFRTRFSQRELVEEGVLLRLRELGDREVEQHLKKHEHMAATEAAARDEREAKRTKKVANARN